MAVVLQCKMCGGKLEPGIDKNIAECEYCGTLQTIPDPGDEKKMHLFERANRYRFRCMFNQAYERYEAIIADFPEEAEAYWGLVLCKYGIEYVDDPVTGRKVPTCHCSSFESVTDDPNYKSALKFASPAAESLYRAEAEIIEQIRKTIIEISGREKPYDIFICYKENDENGKRTLDSVLAQDVYEALVAKGYRVFFSRISLEDKVGGEYEPYIFAALNSARVMLVFGTDREYFQSVWVKNEWYRYLLLMKKDKEKHLIPCYKDMEIHELPKEFLKLQALDLGKIGYEQDLLRGIEKLIKRNPREADHKGKMFSQKLQADLTALLKRMTLFVEDRDWGNADRYCEKILDIDPECAEAYLGKLMVQVKCSQPELLKECAEPFDKSLHYQKIMRFGSEELKKKLEADVEFIKERNELNRLERIYTGAVQQKSSAKTVEDYQKASETFLSIQHYKDAKAQAQKCLENAMAVIYEEAVMQRNSAETAADYEKAAEVFCSVQDYQDAKEQAQNCLEAADAIKKNKIYHEAEEYREKVEIFKNENITSVDKKWVTTMLDKAAKTYEEIPGWKDADLLAKTCREEIQQVEDAFWEESKKRRSFLKKLRNVLLIGAALVAVLLVIYYSWLPQINYRNANQLYQKGSYEDAIEAFEELGAYKDSEELLKDSKYQRANQLCEEECMDEAMEIYIELGNYKDSREIFSTYLSKCKVGDTIAFGNYEQRFLFRGGEKARIQWKILDIADGKMLLISEKCLDTAPYHRIETESGEVIAQEATWATCTLRTWLNEEFLNEAFSVPEQSWIADTTISNADDSEESTEGGTDTVDKIFLLSIEEAEYYFESNRGRRAEATGYAKRKAFFKSSWWWLRSQGIVGQYTAGVKYNGSIHDYGKAADEEKRGVRPAMWIEF